MLLRSKVGGTSRADVGEMKSIVTRALKAAKAAVKEGIVPGKPSIFRNYFGPSYLIYE